MIFELSAEHSNYSNRLMVLYVDIAVIAHMMQQLSRHLISVE